jgi:hypothetical protein
LVELHQYWVCAYSLCSRHVMYIYLVSINKLWYVTGDMSHVKRDMRHMTDDTYMWGEHFLKISAPLPYQFGNYDILKIWGKGLLADWINKLQSYLCTLAYFYILVVKEIFIFDLSRKTIYRHFLEPFTRYVNILPHVNFLF